MFLYTMKRLGSMVPVLFGVTIVMFVVSRMSGGDPTALMLGDRAVDNPELVQAFRSRWGLDQPLQVQYWVYIEHLVRGDLGTSILTKQPVLDDLLRFFPATVELATVAIVMSLLVAIPLGVLAAMRAGRHTDAIIRFVTLLGSSVPIFWLSLLALQVFYLKLGLSPGPGRLSADRPTPEGTHGFYLFGLLLQGDWQGFLDALNHVLLPAAVLAGWTIGVLARITRNGMIVVLRQDYLQTARAKGAGESRVILRHALRNSLIPVVTISGAAFAELLAGAVTTEAIFAWPGIGRYSYQAATGLDFPAIMGVGLLVAVTYLVINLVVDVLYAVLDPRVAAGVH